MRRVAVSAGLFLAACVGVSGVPAPASAASPGLVVAPDRAVPPATPVVSGSCPAVDTPAGATFPVETVLALPGSGSGPWKVPLDQGGTFTGFVAGLSADTVPGPYTFTTQCGGAAPFMVLAAPTLQLVPSGVRAGRTTTATGSCPRPPRGITFPTDVRLDGRLLGTAPVDASTGEFGPFTVVVPDGAAVGPHEVSTACGGRTAVTVLAPAVAPAPPAPPLVVVPDLRGRTGTEAAAAARADHLALVGAAAGPSRIRSQDPPPGTRVRRGSTVSVVLEAAVEPRSTGTPPMTVVAVVIAGLLLPVAVLVVALLSARGVRTRRARRWLDAHVEVRPGRTSLVLSGVPQERVPGLQVRLVVHRDDAPHVVDEERAHAGH